MSIDSKLLERLSIRDLTPDDVGPVAPDSQSDARPPSTSEEALALLFADQHSDHMRYVAKWGFWVEYDGTKWVQDDTLHAFDMARKICRVAAAGCNKSKVSVILANKKTVAAVEALAKSDRRIAATVNQWDQDPWVLNSPDGIINLRSGKVERHDPLAYLTKSAAIGPDDAATCDRWRSVLHRATNGDGDLQSFMQRMFGYSLTGDISAHALFFLYGTGANGKSVILDTVATILNDYHRVAPIETFTASNSDRHPTELAALRGARLVTAIETEEGRRWAESRIKSLTGGDKIAARFMRQDFFEFTPQFKLVIAGNHKPGLRSVDEAIRRRFHLIPFTVTVPPSERDPNLKDKLAVERPGILRWMIQGCLEWQRNGLQPSAAVLNATAAYLESEDAVAAWIDDCCDRDPQAWSSSTDLFASWVAWAKRTGEFEGSARRFAQTLEARGLEPVRKMHGRGFVGISVRPTILTHWSDA